MGKHEIGNGERLVSRKEMLELSNGKQKLLHYSRKTGRTVLKNGHHIVSIVSLHVVALTVIEKMPHLLMIGGGHVA